MVSRFPRRLTAVSATLAAVALGACASKGMPAAIDTTYLDERMSAEEAGYTQVFVDVILAACETARSSTGRRYLRHDPENLASGGRMSDIEQGPVIQRRLVRIGPKTVRPVFRAVRELEVPMVETPPISERQSLAAMVEPPVLYASLHGDIVELIGLIDDVKKKGNVAKVSEVARLVHKADEVCENNRDVVVQALARDMSQAEGTRIALGDGMDVPTASVQPVADDGAVTATVQTASFEGDAGAIEIPEQVQFVTVQTLSETDDSQARIRLFAVRDSLTLDVPSMVEADIKTNDRLDSLVILR